MSQNNPGVTAGKCTAGVGEEMPEVEASRDAHAWALGTSWHVHMLLLHDRSSGRVLGRQLTKPRGRRNRVSGFAK